MNWSEIAHTPVVTQRDRYAADLVILRRQQMSATQDQMYRFIDRTLGRLNDLFDCWMTAPDNENNPVGRVYRQRDFLYLQVDAPKWNPGATSVVLVIHVKLFSGHGLPNRSVSGGRPSKYRISEGRDSLRL